MWGGPRQRERDQTAIFSVKSNHTSEYNFAYICREQESVFQKKYIGPGSKESRDREGGMRQDLLRKASSTMPQAGSFLQPIAKMTSLSTSQGLPATPTAGTNPGICSSKGTTLCSPKLECLWSGGPHYTLIFFIQAKRRNHNTIWPAKWPQGIAMKKAEKYDF